MTWKIRVKYGPAAPMVWSEGYPTKSSATAAKRRLDQTVGNPSKKFYVEKEGPYGRGTQDPA